MIRNYYQDASPHKNTTITPKNYTTNITPTMALKHGCHLRCLKYLKSFKITEDNYDSYYQVNTKQGVYIVTLALQNRKMVIKQWEKI